MFSLGKSSAVLHAAQQPLENLDMADALVSKSTSAGLVKFLASNHKGFMLSPEIFDVLNKLLKSDEDNASGDVQLLCKLFSGEKSTYRFSTESTRTIEANTPFCILGSTQLSNAAKLIARMDHGHGLVGRMLVATPLALRPTLTAMEAAKANLQLEVVDDFEELFQRVSSIKEDTLYKFDATAIQALRATMEDFVAEVNDAVVQGKTPTKSKAPELVPRMATAMHVLTHVMEEILDGNPASDPPSTIPNETFQRAVTFVKHLESQKEILCQVTTDYIL